MRSPPPTAASRAAQRTLGQSLGCVTVAESSVISVWAKARPVKAASVSMTTAVLLETTPYPGAARRLGEGSHGPDGP
jgi:hypothetical protein